MRFQFHETCFQKFRGDGLGLLQKLAPPPCPLDHVLIPLKLLLFFLTDSSNCLMIVSLSTPLEDGLTPGQVHPLEKFTRLYLSTG